MRARRSRFVATAFSKQTESSDSIAVHSGRTPCVGRNERKWREKCAIGAGSIKRRKAPLPVGNAGPGRTSFLNRSVVTADPLGPAVSDLPAGLDLVGSSPY